MVGTTLALTGFALLFVLLFIRLPVGLAMMAVGAAGIEDGPDMRLDCSRRMMEFAVVECTITIIDDVELFQRLEIVLCKNVLGIKGDTVRKEGAVQRLKVVAQPSGKCIGISESMVKSDFRAKEFLVKIII